MTKKKQKKPKAEAKKADDRQVDFIHHWRPEDNPHDPDAVEGSPWQFLRISGDTPAETRDFRNALKLGGGPESGLPCMHCGQMTRIVDEISALDVVQQNVVINGERTEVTFTEEQKARFAKEKLAILMCSNNHLTQFRADVIKSFRERWLQKQAS